MPKKEINDYYFYKIVCLGADVNLCYVGSTANWKQRNTNHKNTCTNENLKEYNSKKYQIIRENGGWKNWKMVKIGYKEQLTKRDAETIEEEYRQQLKASMNSQRCIRTPEYNKEYNKEKNKQYREANKEYLKEWKQEYYEANKDKIKEQVSRPYQCECGSLVNWSSKAAHFRTEKHKNFIQIQELQKTTDI